MFVRPLTEGTISATDGSGDVTTATRDGFLLTLDAAGTATFGFQAPNVAKTYQVYTRMGGQAAGQVVEQYLYDAYGTPTAYDAAGNVRPGGSQYDNRYLFKGSGAYQWLCQAQLYYCRARMYLPQHGRWLQPDPIGQAGGLNIYAYCGNDPVNRIDPEGLEAGSIDWYGDHIKQSTGNYPALQSVGSVTGANGEVSIGSAYIPGGYDVHQSDRGFSSYSGIGSLFGNVARNNADENERASANRSYDWRTNYRQGEMSDADKVFAKFADGTPLGDSMHTMQNISYKAAWASTAMLGGVALGQALQGAAEMEIAVGPSKPIHVAYRAGGRALNALGNRIGWQSMRISAAQAEGFFDEAWFQFTVPVLFPEAVAATAGTTASSCVTAAGYAVGKGWGLW